MVRVTERQNAHKRSPWPQYCLSYRQRHGHIIGHRGEWAQKEGDCQVLARARRAPHRCGQQKQTQAQFVLCVPKGYQCRQSEDVRSQNR